MRPGSWIQDAGSKSSLDNNSDEFGPRLDARGAAAHLASRQQQFFCRFLGSFCVLFQAMAKAMDVATPVAMAIAMAWPWPWGISYGISAF